MSVQLVRDLLVAAVFWSMLAGAGGAQVNVETRLAPDQPPIIGSFRGTADGLPENSLAGFARALEIGVEIIDMQVQLTADGRHVIFHDQFLNHMTDVEAVFETGPASGPTREERAGRDYMSDYTLDELRQLHLVSDGELTAHGIPTLEEALDLVGQQALVMLSLNAFDLDALAADFAGRDTSHMLVYNIDPELLRDVVDATGIPAFASIRRSRVFDTSDNVAILDATYDLLGEALVVAHVNGTSLLTPELLSRAEDLGVLLSTSGGRENFAMEEGNAEPWREAFGSGAIMYWTTYPAEVLALLND